MGAVLRALQLLRVATAVLVVVEVTGVALGLAGLGQWRRVLLGEVLGPPPMVVLVVVVLLLWALVPLAGALAPMGVTV